MNKVKIGWFKFNPKAVIPTKNDEDAGFDIYTIEEDFILEPHTQHLFPTGLGVVVEKGWWLKAEDRGSTGSKGIHIHCGVIDNGFRDEIFICLNNDNNYPIHFTNKEASGVHTHKEPVQEFIGNSLAYRMTQADVLDYVVYPTTKAIAQLVLLPQPEVESNELTREEWGLNQNTKRKQGKLGSSGK